LIYKEKKILYFYSKKEHTKGILRKEMKMKDHRVNKLAKVRAEIAHLKEVEAEHVRALKESGAGTYNGEDHYVVISDVERNTLDMKAVRKKLSRQFIKANTKTTNTLCLKLFGYSKKEAA
jgi:hypothetical protein